MTTPLNICRTLLTSHKSIRFAGLAGRNGELVAYARRPGMTSLLDNSEFETSMVQSWIRMTIRSTLSRKLGNVLYSITAYENVERITMPMYDAAGELEGIVMISVDAGTEIRGNLGKMILDKADELISPLAHP